VAVGAVAAVAGVRVDAVFLAESVAGAGVEGNADLGVAGAGVSVLAIAISTTSVTGSATFSASALASAS
jgi:hypothetical protein